VQLTTFREVYVGHTTTTRAGFFKPTQRCEVWNMDQGAGWEGWLSVMDVDTKEVWMSDPVAELYPAFSARRRAG
jgi:serine/threonine protein phosphatase 1